jgi:hypothetical protein
MRVSKKDCPKASSGATRLWPRSNARGPRRGHKSVAETLKIAERCPIAGGSSGMLGETLLRDLLSRVGQKSRVHFVALLTIARGKSCLTSATRLSGNSPLTLSGWPKMRYICKSFGLILNIGRSTLRALGNWCRARAAARRAARQTPVAR